MAVNNAPLFGGQGGDSATSPSGGSCCRASGPRSCSSCCCMPRMPAPQLGPHPAASHRTALCSACSRGWTACVYSTGKRGRGDPRVRRCAHRGASEALLHMQRAPPLTAAPSNLACRTSSGLSCTPKLPSSLHRYWIASLAVQPAAMHRLCLALSQVGAGTPLRPDQKHNTTEKQINDGKQFLADVLIHHRDSASHIWTGAVGTTQKPPSSYTFGCVCPEGPFSPGDGCLYLESVSL